MTVATILGVGGAHIDRRGQVAGDFIAGASNPGIMGEDVGGGTFNALRNAVLRGACARLMSVRGGDAAGVMVASAIAQAGIDDLSVTFLDRATPSYTAILSSDGDVVAALADMGLYEMAFPRQMRRSSLRKAAASVDAILCDANLPRAALAQLARLAEGKPLFAIAISPAKAVRLDVVLPDLACLFLNVREAAALSGLEGSVSSRALVAGLRGLGLRSAVLSHGAEPIIAFDSNTTFSLQPPAPRKIADVTGAGDALAGATIAALLSGLPLAEAVRHGMAAAMLALESASPVADVSGQVFAEALALVPQAMPLHQEMSTKDAHVA